MGEYRMTDDPNDPCPYCVVWVEQPDDLMGEHAVPTMPDGPVDRVYRYIHRECDEMVWQYEAERDRA